LQKQVCIYIHAHTCFCKSRNAHCERNIYTYIYTYIRMYVCMYVCMYVYTYVCVCVCVCVCVYNTYIYIRSNFKPTNSHASFRHYKCTKHHLQIDLLCLN
jgi:hypothetical protein